MRCMVSVIVPVYNEEKAIGQTVRDIQAAMGSSQREWELLCVDDGSSDGTAGILKEMPGVTVIRHARNQGYGTALKTGIRKAKGDTIAIIDADGTYPIKDFPKLVEKLYKGEHDMVVGARTKAGAKVPLTRRPGKAIITALAAFLVGQRIPDLNSGMRVFKKDLAEKFWHLLPAKWSFTVTITLAALTNGYSVWYEPIDYYERVGESTVNFSRGLFQSFPNFISLIIRIVTYFKPLRFFAIPSLLFLIVGAINLVRTLIFERNITDASMLLIVVGIQIGLMGLIADLIVKSRR